MQFPDTIETGHLLLRKSELSDAQPIFEQYATDPEVTRYLTWRPCTHVSQVTSYLEKQILKQESGREHTWIITRPGDDTAISAISAGQREHGVNVGYVLGSPYWGSGFMTEAVSAVVGAALENPEVYRVWATCDVDNPRSARVLEKCGFAREGVLRRWVVHPNVSDVPRDKIVYAFTR